MQRSCKKNARFEKPSSSKWEIDRREIGEGRRPVANGRVLSDISGGEADW